MPALPASLARAPACSLLVVFGVALAAGCSHHDGEETAGGDASVTSLAPAPPAPSAPSPPPAAASARAPARDARADQTLIAVADAGRLCGDKGLPDCPLEAWMKRIATPAIEVGETTGLADAFDQMASLAPSADLAPGGYVNWVSIALDGAAAARMGDVNAAKAACRECHAQYRAKYHDALRALPLATRPPAAR